MANISSSITSVKENLGNRSSGLIGGTPVDTVVLNGLNKGFKNIIKQANPEYYNRIATLTLTPDNYKYAEPTQDISGNSIVIKYITGCNLKLVNSTSSYRIFQINMKDYLEYDLADNTSPGIPSIFAHYNSLLWFTNYPDDNYTLTLACTVIPEDVKITDVSTTSFGVDDTWIEVIEAYATHYCFAKLQQTQDSLYWLGIYEECKRQSKSITYKDPLSDKPSGYPICGGDPLTDPFVRRFN